MKIQNKKSDNGYRKFEPIYRFQPIEKYKCDLLMQEKKTDKAIIKDVDSSTNFVLKLTNII